MNYKIFKHTSTTGLLELVLIYYDQHNIYKFHIDSQFGEVKLISTDSLGFKVPSESLKNLTTRMFNSLFIVFDVKKQGVFINLYVKMVEHLKESGRLKNIKCMSDEWGQFEKDVDYALLGFHNKQCYEIENKFGDQIYVSMTLYGDQFQLVF